MCALAGYLASPARAEPPPGSGLAAQLAAAVEAAALGDRISVSIVDLQRGQGVLAHRPASARNPASNMKLLTAAAALLELGADFRLRTGVYGRSVDGRAEAGLCLKGGGDPTLGRAELLLFAQRASDEGVRQVDEVVIDAGYFDAEYLPPLFDQQPHEAAPFRACVAALSVKENAYSLRVRPASVAGALASVRLDASGYFELDNTLSTSEGGRPLVIAEDRATETGAVLSLRGNVPLGTPDLIYERRVPSPLPFAGHLFIDALRSAGITAAQKVTLGSCPPELPLIHLHSSAPLGQILARLGKDSDNFVAEMLLKTLGAERTHRPGTSSDGAAVVTGVLTQLGLATDGLVVRNGSGLFRGNLVSTQLLSSLLAAMYENPAYRDDYLTQLAVGGVDGTLVRRFRRLPRARIVRAKTGTLDDVIALSGYVLGPTPEQAYAFSYIANNVAGRHGQARKLIDQLVEILADHLYGTQP